jgi:hypothetical protein
MAEMLRITVDVSTISVMYRLIGVRQMLGLIKQASGFPVICAQSSARRRMASMKTGFAN